MCKNFKTCLVVPTEISVVVMQRRLPSPGLQVEVVILDHDAPIPKKKTAEGTVSQSAATTKEPSTPLPQESADTEEGSRSQPADAPTDRNIDQSKG